MERRAIIAVIGSAQASERGLALARAVGRSVARSGAVLLCGGLYGVMEQACRGCTEEGGLTLGVLPGSEPGQANPYVQIALPTNMGHARNVIIAHSAQALIAIEGEYGTLSEMAVALKLGRPVIALECNWPLDGVAVAKSPEHAVEMALERMGRL